MTQDTTIFPASWTEYDKATAETPLSEMTAENELAWVVANWNIATDEQKARASVTAAVGAAERYTEILVNRAMGFIFDYRTGEFVEVK